MPAPAPATYRERVRRYVWLLAVVLLVPACGRDVADPAGDPAGGRPNAGPRPGPAWQAVLAEIGPDGTATAATALRAFSLAHGRLPGVSPPAGDAGVIPSGTWALRALVGHWDAITPEQRRAAAELVPSLATLPDAGAGSGQIIGAGHRAGPTPRRGAAFYTELAEEIAEDIGARVGRPLGLPVTATTASVQKPKVGADTGVYTASGGYRGAPGKCVITVYPAGDAWDGDDVGAMIAHEVWHCFQGAVLGLARFWDPAEPAWVSEGQAEWVGASVYPNAPINAMFWPDYLASPATPLTKRSYDAIGFYVQLAQSGVDVWSRLVPTLLASGHAASYAAAGAQADPFLDIWASGYGRRDTRGAAWDITGPGVTGPGPAPTPLSVPDKATVAVHAGAYANALYGVTDDSAEVLHVTATGPARVSDPGQDHVVRGDAMFCHRPAGCKCPDADQPATPLLALPGPEILLALTGGPKGADGHVQGLSLKEYCARGPLSGTWTGAWVNDNGLAVGEGTLTLAQQGQRVTGSARVTGKTCVRQATVTGTVAGSTVHLVVAGARVVTMDGRLSGSTMSGSWSAPSCGPPYGPKNVTVTVTGTWHAARTER
jgi:hypothetical protein